MFFSNLSLRLPAWHDWWSHQRIFLGISSVKNILLFFQSKFPKSTGAQQKAASCLGPVSWQLPALWPDLKSNRPELKEQTSRKSSEKQPRNQHHFLPISMSVKSSRKLLNNTYKIGLVHPCCLNSSQWAVDKLNVDSQGKGILKVAERAYKLSSHIYCFHGSMDLTTVRI